MKKLVSISAAVAIVAMAGSAFAAPPKDATVTINANVSGTCQVATQPGAINLTLDPSSGSAATATSSFTLWCTNGTTYAINDPNSSSAGSYNTALVGVAPLAPTDTIAMNLAYTNSTGTGAGKSNAITSALTASVANAAFIDAKAGDYSKTVTLTVTP